MSVQASVSRGYLAVFSTNPQDQAGGSSGHGGNAIGLAAGGGGLAWRDGALQDVRLGGTTSLDGDLDLKGHRLLNFNFDAPDIDRVDVSYFFRFDTLVDLSIPADLNPLFVLTDAHHGQLQKNDDTLRHGP